MVTVNSSIELPDYIQQRHAQVASAGLTMLRVKVSDTQLSTAFEGTPEQFLQSGFITDEQRFEKFVSQKSKTAGITSKFMEIFTPDEHCYPSLFRRAGGIFRIVITGETLPQESKTISPAIQMYRFVIPSKQYGKEEVLTYAAKSIELLIDAGIAPAKALEESWERAEGRDCSGAVLWHKRESCSMVFFRSYVTAQQAAEKIKDEASKSAFDSPESYKEQLLYFVEMGDRMLSNMQVTHTKNGFVYSLPNEVMECINSHLAGLHACIANCTPAVRRDGGFKLIAGGKQ